MTLQAEFGALDRASRLVAEIRDSIEKEQSSVGADVDDLISSRWSGAAADQFAAAWRQWSRGMSEILSGLGLESDAIAVTRAQLAGSDADAQAAARRLHDRLGEVAG